MPPPTTRTRSPTCTVSRDAAQEIDGVEGTAEVLARDAELTSGVCAYAEKDGGKLIEQLAEAYLASHSGLVADLDTLALDERDLLAQHSLGQAILGDAHVQHAARNWQVLVDHRSKARSCQVVGCREAGRSRPHDCHPRAFRAQCGGPRASVGVGGVGFCELPGPGGCRRPVESLGTIGGPALDGVDGDGGLGLGKSAVGFAGVRAGAADDPGQRVVLPHGGCRQVGHVLSGLEEVGGAVDARRAGGTAGCGHPRRSTDWGARLATGVPGEVVRAQLDQGE